MTSTHQDQFCFIFRHVSCLAGHQLPEHRFAHAPGKHVLFSQAHLGTGFLSPWLAHMSLQNSYGVSAIPGLLPLRAAMWPLCGILHLQYGVLSRKGLWCSLGPCSEEGLSSALSMGHSPQAGEWSSTVPSTESPNPRHQQPWNRNPRGLQTEVVQPPVKNAPLLSSQILRCSCCQNLYKQITLLSGIQQETEREIPCPGTLETYPQYSE